MKQRKRIVFFGEGITMSHFARPAALAKSLDPDRFEAFFFTPKRYHHFVSDVPFEVRDLRTIDPKAFLDRMAHGGTLHSADEIKAYVEEDRAILREIKPDMVVGDFRLSLSISAPLEQARHAAIMSAYWSPFTTQPAIVPELPITRHIPARFLNPVFSLIRPFAFAPQIKPFNIVRKAYGLPPVPLSLPKLYNYSDLILYPDIPEFIPMRNAPPGHRYIGTCSWSTDVPKPEWWRKASEDPLPKIFVSMGSAGSLRVISALLEALRQLPVKVILSASGRDLAAQNDQIFRADYLPYDETVALSSVVVSHGGTGGYYPALAAGVPALLIPSNIDQHLAAAALQRQSAGLVVRAEEATANSLHSALNRLLSERVFTDEAKKWSRIFAAHDTGKLFHKFLDDTL